MDRMEKIMSGMPGFDGKGGCPRRCRARHKLRRSPHPLPDFPDLLGVPHYGAEYAGIAAAVVAISAMMGTAVAMYGQYQSAQQQQAVLQYNAMIARQQAQYQSEYALASAQIEAALMERQAEGITALAASNIAMSEQMTAAQVEAAKTAGEIRERQMAREYQKTQSQVR